MPSPSPPRSKKKNQGRMTPCPYSSMCFLSNCGHFAPDPFRPKSFRPKSFRPNSKSFRPNSKTFRPNSKSFRPDQKLVRPKFFRTIKKATNFNKYNLPSIDQRTLLDFVSMRVRSGTNRGTNSHCVAKFYTCGCKNTSDLHV